MKRTAASRLDERTTVDPQREMIGCGRISNGTIGYWGTAYRRTPLSMPPYYRTFHKKNVPPLSQTPFFRRSEK